MLSRWNQNDIIANLKTYFYILIFLLIDIRKQINRKQLRYEPDIIKTVFMAYWDLSNLLYICLNINRTLLFILNRE